MSLMFPLYLMLAYHFIGLVMKSFFYTIVTSTIIKMAMCGSGSRAKGSEPI